MELRCHDSGRKNEAAAHSPAVMIPVEGTGTTVMFWDVWDWCRCPPTTLKGPPPLLPTPPPPMVTPPPSCLGITRSPPPPSTEPGMASTAVG